MKFKTKIGLLKHLPGMHYIEIPTKIVQAFGGKFNVRLICRVNSLLSFRGGFVALGKGKAYITISKKRMELLKIKNKDIVNIELEIDKDQLGTEIPEEVLTILHQDQKAQARFEKLTPGKKRALLNHVSAVKNPDLRLERATCLLENLKHLPEGKESFREILGLPKKRV